jgi:DNA-binding transcriptional regulator YiaG
MTVLEMRKAAGMTQKQFHEYFGIPKRNIEDWENGRAECKPYLAELMLYKLKKEGLIRE